MPQAVAGPQSTAPQPGLTFRRPETYVLFAAFAALVWMVTVLFQKVSVSEEEWGRLLSVANGPGAAFLIIVGGLAGFAINRGNVIAANKEKDTAREEKDTAVEKAQTAELEKKGLGVKLANIGALLDASSLRRVDDRRGDNTRFIQSHNVISSPYGTAAGKGVGDVGFYTIAPIESALHVDPLVEELAHTLKACKQIVETP